MTFSAELQVAKDAVSAAVKASMRHFRAGVHVEVKPDRSPVTIADREAEEAIIGVIRAKFPSHAMLTEESGAHEGDKQHRWIVDPLDGTRGFSRGGSFWGPLVAYEQEGQVVVGAMALPVIGELYYAAKGAGAFRVACDAEGKISGEPVRLRVSGIKDWRDATLSLGELQRQLDAPFTEGLMDLATTSAQTRCFGDLAACAMLLNGRAEAWIEWGVKTWDLAPLKILVEEAGGKFTDMKGKLTHESGDAVGTNGLHHDRVLSALVPEATH